MINELTRYGLAESIQSASPEQIDAIWSILKYKEIGILRKIKSMCAVLHIDSQNIIKDFPTSDNGRIIDKKARNIIHKALISVS